MRKFPVIFAVVLGTLLSTQSSVSTQSAGSLPFAKQFLIPGNYVVGSVDLVPSSQGNGQLSGTIDISGVPANAEVIAAFLYFETITSNVSQNDGAQFRGQEVEVVKKTPQLLDPSLGPCWTGGGQGGTMYTMTGYRADVFRELPRKKDANNVPTGRILVNSADLAANGYGPNTVTLPERGTGNVVPVAAGATLVVFYRDLTQPLTSISLYDGLSVRAPGVPYVQPLRGVLQSAASPQAKLTLIGGSGANNQTDRISFQNSELAVNAFASAATATSDRGWSSPTFNVSSLVPGTDANDGYGETVTARVSNSTPVRPTASRFTPPSMR